ncbi:MAG: ABC transporter ATP-binding protein [Acidiferrobacterales bacterium]
MSYGSAVPMVVAQHVSKQVNSPTGDLLILDDVSLTIASGEAIAIVGASGSGKSTLLGLLAGLDVPTAGRVILDGIDLTTLDEDGRARLRSGRVGFVFQTFQLLQSLTALENVMLPLELAGEAAASPAAAEILKRVGLEARLHHYPNQLSGGEQQRCAIARAFAGKPKLLFADEPTGNLEQTTGARIIELLFALNSEQAATLVLVTHDREISEHCHRLLELEAGRLKENHEGH